MSTRFRFLAALVPLTAFLLLGGWALPVLSHCGHCSGDAPASSGSRQDAGREADNTQRAIGTIGILLRATEASRRQAETCVPAPPPDTPSVSTPPPGCVCHCQSGRLMIIAGVFDLKDPLHPERNRDRFTRVGRDTAIVATMEWAASLGVPHTHLVAFPSISSSDPIQMQKPYECGDGQWRPVDFGSKRRPSAKEACIALARSWHDCCCFDEVIVILHGHQTGYSELIANLPYLLDGKPVRKFVLWSCRSSRKFYPGTDISRNYQKICGILRPRNCPGGCTPETCQGRDADGRPMKCPTARDQVRIYASHVFRGKAVRLGLDPHDRARPFTTPDGRLREITVLPDGTIRAAAIDAAANTSSVTIFGGLGVKADTSLIGGGQDTDEKYLLRDAKIIEPPEVASTVPPCWEATSHR